MSRTVCVVGSIRMDLTISTEALPVLGETRFGGDLELSPGGRGVEQAVAAARLGAHARLIGCVGDDPWASEIRTALATDGVDAAGVSIAAEQATGTAFISSVPGAGNSVLISSGANASFSPEHVDAQAEAIAEADILLLQLGVPLDVAERAIALAADANTRVVLHAAPFRELPAGWLDRVDVLVVNELDGRRIAGCDDDVEAIGVARRLKAKFSGRVVVLTDLGSAVSFDGEKKLRADAPRLDADDGAGLAGAADAFAAALAVALAGESRTERALHFACAARALAASRAGTLACLPTLEEVRGVLGEENENDGNASGVHSPA